MKKSAPVPATRVTLAKAPTGITGLDELTGGGLPAGRPTLVCGSAGCGKTMLAMEFLRRFIGDMSQTERILLGLDLRSREKN